VEWSTPSSRGTYREVFDQERDAKKPSRASKGTAAHLPHPYRLIGNLTATDERFEENARGRD
jgi:hypothetical protein